MAWEWPIEWTQIHREAYVDSAGLCMNYKLSTFFNSGVISSPAKMKIYYLAFVRYFLPPFLFPIFFLFQLLCLRLDLALRACTSSAFFVHPQVKITLMKGDGLYLGCIIYMKKGYSVFLSVISKGWKLTLWIWYCHCNMISFLSADMSLSQ